MSNLKERALTSILFVIVLLGSIVLSELTSSILFLLIIFLCQREFYQFFKPTEISPQASSGIFAGIALFGISVLVTQFRYDADVLFLITPIVFFIFIVELYRKRKTPLSNIGITLLGLIYVAIPFIMLHQIAYYKNFEFGNNYSYELLLGYFFLLWANDTGAYFVGRSLGKNKLFERISPKKTWEGSIGGILSGLLVGYINFLIFPNIELWVWLSVAIIVVLFGSLGDLVESLFKRSLKIKDSGNLLPGHGGVLDRFDGILISAPIVYSFLRLLAYFN